MDFLERLFGMLRTMEADFGRRFYPVLLPFIVALYCSLRRKRMSDQSRM